jgi:hypothetical protein
VLVLSHEMFNATLYQEGKAKKVHKMRDNMKAFISISSKTPGWSILAFSISHIFPICAYHKLLKAAHSLRVIQDKSIDNIGGVPLRFTGSYRGELFSPP